MSKILFMLLIALANLGLGFVTALLLGTSATCDLRKLRCFRRPLRGGTAGTAGRGASENENEPGAPTRTPANSSVAMNQKVTSAVETARWIDRVMSTTASKLASLQKSLSKAAQNTPQLEALASEVDGNAQQTLKQISAAIDALRQIEDNNPAEGPACQKRIQQLDSAWARFNESAVQMAMLTFDDRSASRTASQLGTALEAMQGACRETRQSLAREA